MPKARDSRHLETRCDDRVGGALWRRHRFADYREKVVDLPARVTTVSVRTVEITSMMARAARDDRTN